MYDPDIDVEKEIKEYMEKGFGKGAAAMERYFNKLEDLKPESWEYCQSIEILRSFDKKTIASLRTELDAAKKAIMDKSSKEYRRVVLIENAVLYAEMLHLAYEQIVKAGGSQESVEKAKEAIIDFCRKHSNDADANYLHRVFLTTAHLPYFQLTATESSPYFYQRKAR